MRKASVSPPSPFQIPLWFVFVLQLLVVAAAIAAVTVVLVREVHTTANSGTTQALTLALRSGGVRISGPIDSLANQTQLLSNMLCSTDRLQVTNPPSGVGAAQLQLHQRNISMFPPSWSTYAASMNANVLAGYAYENACLDDPATLVNLTTGEHLPCTQWAENGCSRRSCFATVNRTQAIARIVPRLLPSQYNVTQWSFQSYFDLSKEYYVAFIRNITQNFTWSAVYPYGGALLLTGYQCLRFDTANASNARCMHSVSMDVSLSYVAPLLEDLQRRALLGVPGSQVQLLDSSTGVVLVRTKSSVATPSFLSQAALETFSLCRQSNTDGNCPTEIVLLNLNDYVVAATELLMGSTPVLLVFQMPRTFFFGTLERNLVVAGAIVAVMSFLTVVISFGLFGSISQTVEQLVKNFHLAAQLMNEQVTPAMSRIREMQRLNMEFILLNSRLLVARAFLPASVLLTGVLPSPENESPKMLATPSGSDEVDANPLEMVDSIAVAASSSSPALTSPKLSDILHIRNVAVLVANINGFESAIYHSLSDGKSIHRAVLTEMEKAVSTFGGILDGFHGDRFFAFFNAASPLAEPVDGAVQSMLCTLQQLQQLTASLPQFNGVRFGLSSGSALCGTFGTERMRRFSVVGPCVAQAAWLAQYCRGANINNCLCESATAELPRGRYAVLHVDSVKIPKAPKKNLLTTVLGRAASVPTNLRDEDSCVVSAEALSMPGIFPTIVGAPWMHIAMINQAFEYFQAGRIAEAEIIANRLSGNAALALRSVLLANIFPSARRPQQLSQLQQ